MNLSGKKSGHDVDNIMEQVFTREEPKSNRLVKNLIGFGMVVAFFLCSFLLIYNIPTLQSLAVKAAGKSGGHSDQAAEMAGTLDQTISKIQKDVDEMTPTDPFIVINSSVNTFLLFKDKKVVRTGRCSTGSLTRLKSGKKVYLFKTPKGVHKVIGKKTNPVWTKPDWAFIEDGLPIPPPGHPSRIEENVLGDYALSIGNGYMIHGTIYKRQLGMAVTHGCIRLNDDDLEAVYNTLIKGSKVYVY